MAAEDLYQQLKHKNPRLRERAMRQIASERNADTIPRLMAILSDEDVVYRRAAVQALGVIGLDAVPTLVEQLTSSDNETIRASCAKALAACALNFPEEKFPKEALAGLQTALQDPNPVVKISAVGALGTVGLPALDILINAMTIDDIALQVAIIQALGSLGDSQAAQVLGDLAHNEAADPYIRESATSALSRLDRVAQFKSKASS